MAIAELLAGSPVFSQMKSEERRRLAGVARMIVCRGRTVIHSAGNPSDHIFLVVSGQAELVSVNRSGVETAVGVFGPGQWLTWLALFDPIPTERDIQADDRTRLLAVPANEVRAIMAENPALYPLLMAEISKRFRTTLRLQEHRMTTDRDQRVGQILLLLADFGGDGAKVPRLRITRSQLAQRAACSRQSLYESLDRMAGRGLVALAYGEIELPDVAGLRQFCAV